MSLTGDESLAGGALDAAVRALQAHAHVGRRQGRFQFFKSKLVRLQISLISEQFDFRLV